MSKTHRDINDISKTLQNLKTHKYFFCSIFCAKILKKIVPHINI